MVADEQRLRESSRLLLTDVASESYTAKQKVGCLAMWLGQESPTMKAVLDGLCKIANSTNNELTLQCLAVLLDFRRGMPVSQNTVLWKLARQKDWVEKGDQARLRALGLVLGAPSAGRGELLKLVLQVPQVEMPAALCIIVGATTTGSSPAQAEESIVLKLDQGQRHPFVEKGVPEILGAVFRCPHTKTIDVLQQLLKRATIWSKAAFIAARKMIVHRLIARSSLSSLRDHKREFQLECLGAVAGISQNANETMILERLCTDHILESADVMLAVLEVLYELPKVSSRSDTDCLSAIIRLIGNGKCKFGSDTVRLQGYACLVGARPPDRPTVLSKLAQSIQEGKLPVELGGDMIRSMLLKQALCGKFDKHDMLKKIDEARDISPSLRKQLSDSVLVPPAVKNDVKTGAGVSGPDAAKAGLIPGTTGKAGSRVVPSLTAAVRPKSKAAPPGQPPTVNLEEVDGGEGSSYEDYYSASEDEAPDEPAPALKTSTMAERLRALRAQKEALGQRESLAHLGASNGSSQDSKEFMASRTGARTDATAGRSRGDHGAANGPLTGRQVSRTDATVPRSKARPTRHRAPLYGTNQDVDQPIPKLQENESSLKRRRQSPRSVSPYLMRPGLSPPRYADTDKHSRSRSPCRLQPAYDDEKRPIRRRRKVDPESGAPIRRRQRVDRY